MLDTWTKEENDRLRELKGQKKLKTTETKERDKLAEKLKEIMLNDKIKEADARHDLLKAKIESMFDVQQE